MLDDLDTLVLLSNLNYKRAYSQQRGVTDSRWDIEQGIRRGKEKTRDHLRYEVESKRAFVCPVRGREGGREMRRPSNLTVSSRAQRRILPRSRFYAGPKTRQIRILNRLHISGYASVP